MKLIIDIPKANYEKMKIMDGNGSLENPYLMAIAQGTPLPKEQKPKTDINELIDMLTIVKDQAIKSNNDTAIINIKIDSFNFVIDKVIKALRKGGSKQ